MRKKWIVGNWKMHGNKQFVKAFLTELKNKVIVNSAVSLVVCPPFVFLEQVQEILKETTLEWGAQNMAVQRTGPYTGEVSAPMLLEYGCRYVLLGHSERRQLFGETNEQIEKKFQLAQALGLTPILCLGETLAERQAKQTHKVLKEQLSPVLNRGKLGMQPLILAYEPVWAIGTGITATPEQAKEAHAFLRELLSGLDQELAQKLPILYGGSVKPGNAEALFNTVGIDGGLIGGASLHAQEFLAICEDCISSIS